MGVPLKTMSGDGRKRMTILNRGFKFRKRVGTGGLPKRNDFSMIGRFIDLFTMKIAEFHKSEGIALAFRSPFPLYCSWRNLLWPSLLTMSY